MARRAYSGGVTMFTDGVLPIKIRDDIIVRVAHLPHDLTKKEADKIIRIIMAHVNSVVEE